ncbi:hypothetical protein FBU30_002645 [Linnemannia zychae]|nr:hypothetical protein FBU30_002645 [Linnemannia zychae]
MVSHNFIILAVVAMIASVTSAVPMPGPDPLNVSRAACIVDKWAILKPIFDTLLPQATEMQRDCLVGLLGPDDKLISNPTVTQIQPLVEQAPSAAFEFLKGIGC